MQIVEDAYADELCGVPAEQRFGSPADARFAFELDEAERVAAAKENGAATAADAVRAGLAAKRVSVRAALLYLCMHRTSVVCCLLSPQRRSAALQMWHFASSDCKHTLAAPQYDRSA